MNHDIPNTTVVSTSNTENTEVSHESVDDQSATELGGVALDAAAKSQLAPNIEQMKKVESAYFLGSPDDLLEQIDAGEISVDDIDFEDRTPLMMMAAQGHIKAVEALIARGANLNCISMFQGRIPMSALDAARQTNREEIKQLLLDNGAKSGREIRAEQLAAEQGK